MKSFISILLCLTLTSQSMAATRTVRTQTIENQMSDLLVCLKLNNQNCQESKFDTLISTLENAASQGMNPLKIQDTINKELSEARRSGQYDNASLDFYEESLNYFFNTESITSKDLENKISNFISCLKSDDKQCKKRDVKALAKALVTADKNDVPKDELADLVLMTTSQQIQVGDIEKEKLQEFSDLLDEELKFQYTSSLQDLAVYTIGAAVGAIVVALIAVNTIGLLERFSRGTRYSRNFDRDHNLGYGGIAFVGSLLAGVFVTGPMAVELSQSMSNSMELMLKDDLEDLL